MTEITVSTGVTWAALVAAIAASIAAFATVGLLIGAYFTATRVGQQIRDNRELHAAEMFELRASRDATLRPLVVATGRANWHPRGPGEWPELRVSGLNPGVGPGLSIKCRAWVIEQGERRSVPDLDEPDYVTPGVLSFHPTGENVEYRLEPLDGFDWEPDLAADVVVGFRYSDLFHNEFPSEPLPQDLQILPADPPVIASPSEDEV